MTDEAVSSTATWQAANALDLAGEHQRRAEVLEGFIRERPGNTRVPEALLRLGQTYQAIDAYDKAIDAYQQNLTDFPRTYWAVQCLVPLAECFLDTRQMEKAEQTLLRVVDRQPEDPMALIKPEAQEYRDSLFRLGDLYIQSEQYEKAIGRFEEALRRYPEDKRSDRVAFLMADAYRRSAAQIRADLKDPKKVAFKDELKVQHQDRLKRAEELFAQVIERYRNRSQDSLADLDRQYVKLSHFYRADSIYDRSYLADPSDMQPYVQALQRYDEAAWLYQYDSVAMSAYVQIVNCYLRMGNIHEARKALRRAGWALRNIPDDRFDPALPGGGREYWEKYLSWLEKTPMFVAGKVEG
jgi:tetratricopeptide (TPR) repeat protein